MAKNAAPDLQKAYEILERLVSYRSVSTSSNLDLVDFVQSYLSGLDVPSTRVLDPTGRKASLFASIGPDVPGGTILSGHTDVVTTDGQSWTFDPWKLTEHQGRLYGRGTCDMKGFCALVLSLVPAMQQANLERPLQIALSYDEEIGCFGALPMIAKMRAELPLAANVIVGEPTLLRPVNGHKGTLALLTRLRGVEVHSARCDLGVSAVMNAAKLLSWLDNAMTTNSRQIAALQVELADYEPPYTTLHVGKITGGTAANITARKCSFTTDIRVVPGESIDTWFDRYMVVVREVESSMRAVSPEASISVNVLARVPGCVPEPEGPAEALVRRLTHVETAGKVGFASEAGLFQEAGYSAVICGPGSIEQAHQQDEYVSRDQFARGYQFLEDLIASQTH